MTAAGYVFVGLVIGFVAGYFTCTKRTKQEVILISGSSHELNLF